MGPSSVLINLSCCLSLSSPVSRSHLSRLFFEGMLSLLVTPRHECDCPQIVFHHYFSVRFVSPYLVYDAVLPIYAVLYYPL